MTREEVNEKALQQIDKHKYLILELATGFGKSKLAINLINHIQSKHNKTVNILLLVAKTVHKQTWLNEINKWGGLNNSWITIECYESLKKYKDTTFDIVVCDELQHLSELRKEILETITINLSFIGLSATIKRELKDYFKYKYNANIISCSLGRAIEDNVLPEPVIYLLPLSLDNSKYTFKAKKFKREFITTQKGYYDTLSSLIEWYKGKYFITRNERIKNLWLSTAGKRLKWLSEQKEYIITSLLDKFKEQRTLTFCSSIEQSERLGKYNITSKNKDSVKNLDMFNSNKIKHITAVNILNEGVNLTNCRIGIFCNLNSSEIITKQRTGRLLRHKSPIIIIPYYSNTREEELAIKMLEEYNPNLIKKVYNINSILI